MTRWMLVCWFGAGLWAVMLSAAQAQQVAQTLDVVGQSYRFPPVEPDAALNTFTVQQGFQLQLVAQEPLVSDPIDGCFDASGRLYVAEMHGYPYSEEIREQQPEPLGKKDACLVRRLEDQDKDGIFETSTIYASGISWVTSVACWQEGLFVLAPSKLYYFKDNDGDGVAEHREIVLEGFSRANVQGLANNMKWGLDGRLYFSGGINGGELLQNGQSIGNSRGRDIALNPRNRQVEFITGGRQFGHSFDDWGTRFVCSNSNHIQQVLFPAAALDKGLISTVGDPVISIGKEGAAAPVFRKSPAEPWRIERTARRAADPAFRSRLPMTELVPTGFFTSATGVTIYRGDAYPAEFQGNAFIGDVGGNLIHRKVLTRSGPRWTAERADEDVEFLTSTDTWFRPANFVNGPDGCLYILDMYRETIEHPASIPEDIKAKVDLQSGDDRGRVYRLVPPSGRGKPWISLAERTSAELVEFLAHPNAWQRETAARLLLERQDRTVAEPLRQLTHQSPVALGRLHGLYSLRMLGLLKEIDLSQALDDPNPNIVAHAVALCEPFLSNPETILRKRLMTVAHHPDQLVRFQLGLTLTGVVAKYRQDLWQALANTEGNSSDVQAALLLATPPHEVPIAVQLLQAQTPNTGLLYPILGHLGRTAEDPALCDLLRTVLAQATPDMQLICLTNIAQGLRSRQKSLDTVLASDAALAEQWKQQCVQRAFVAINANAAAAERIAAVNLLAYAPAELALPAYVHLLANPQSAELTQTVVRSAGQHVHPEVVALLAGQAVHSTPELKHALLVALLGMPGGPQRILDHVASGLLSPNDLLPAEREQLRQHPSEAIRAKFAAMKEFEVNADRQAVIASFQPTLELMGDLERARPLYTKHCAGCHRLGEQGQNVGPEFKSVKNKSTADLLVAILDPSREAQPTFLGYNVLLNDGRSLTGLIVSDTAAGITLRQAEGKEVQIARSEIEALKSTGLSLMPTGLEKVLTPQDLADIMALIKE